MGFSDKSDIIEKGKNLLVLRNKGKTSHTLTIEMSVVSNSYFSPVISSHPGSDSNLILTTKTAQTCLRDFYISCDGATPEAVVTVPLNTAFKLTIDDVEYSFNNVQDYLERAKSILPIKTEVLLLENLCENATSEAGITLEPNVPFRITIDSIDYYFTNIQELMDKKDDPIFSNLVLKTYAHISEIPVNIPEFKTSKVYPIIVKESLLTNNTLVLDTQKHLNLSPSLSETFNVSAKPLDVYIRIDGEKLLLDTVTNDGKNKEDANYIKNNYKVNDSIIKSPLLHLTASEESFTYSCSVLDPMLRDNLILGYSEISSASLSYNVFDAFLSKDVHDAFVTEGLSVASLKVLDPEIREHAYEMYDLDNKLAVNNFAVLDATTRDMLVILKDNEINSVTASVIIGESTIKDHLLIGTSPVENVTTNYAVLDSSLKNDLIITENLEEISNTFIPFEPVLSFTRHENFDTLNSVQTAFSLIEPVIDGETVVPISCSGSLHKTEAITFNGQFHVYLDGTKLNSQSMTIEQIKDLLLNYNIRIDLQA